MHIPGRSNGAWWPQLLSFLGLVALIVPNAFAEPGSRRPISASSHTTWGRLHPSQSLDHTLRAETTIGGFGPRLPMVPETPARPTKGPESIASFVEGISQNDGMFEVVVGQGRLLITKENIAAGGIPSLVAVGDPSVIDFEVVGPRQIRVIGQRIGVTDLAITTSDNRTYSIEVQVGADLHVLRAQLQALFPDARLKLYQLRDHIVVQGQARNTIQVGRILDTIRAYLVSIGQDN